MKHTVCSVNVQLDFPEEWGNPTTIIFPSKGYGYALHDVIYRNFAKWISMANQYPKPGLAYMEDICNGFDITTFRVRVLIDGDMELLESTIATMKKELHRAYMQIPHVNRKRAKAPASRV